MESKHRCPPLTDPARLLELLEWVGYRFFPCEDGLRWKAYDSDGGNTRHDTPAKAIVKAAWMKAKEVTG